MRQRLMSRLAALVFLALAGCNGNSGSSSGSGDLSVSLTDAASPEYKAVYISVNQVEVKASADDDENGWLVLDIIDKTINLLDLTGGTLESIGTRTLPAEDYNQLRLHLASAPDSHKNLNGNDHPFANYVIETDNAEHELKVPSGYQSGIKLVKQFTIADEGLTELILDFDAMKSVVKTGSSGKWLLKPVIRIMETTTLAGIDGAVTNTATGSGVRNARVTVQTFNATFPDPKDNITVHSGTLTDVTGNSGAYLLRIPAGDYTLVVFKDGFRPECRRVTAITGDTITEDVALSAATSGTLTVTVSGLSIIDDSVTVSVRKDDLCGETLTTFYEVTSQSFGKNGDFVMSLPPGDYTVVAYGNNLTPTITNTRTITSGGNKTITVAF